MPTASDGKMPLGKIDHEMLHGPAQVGVHDEGGISPLRADEREIRDGGGFSFARSAADERDRVRLRIRPIELDVRSQNSIRFGIRRVAFGFVKQVDVLWNDRENRNAEETLDVVHRLHAGVEILNEKGEADSDDKTDQRAKREIQSNSWPRRINRRLGDLFDADCEARHRQLHCLGLSACPDAVE